MSFRCRHSILLAMINVAVLVAGCDTLTPAEPPPASLTASVSRATEAPAHATSGCTLAGSDTDVLAEVAALRAEVGVLESAGALTAGQAHALRNHLDNAERKITEGHNCPALAQLRAFRDQVADFVDDGVLTPDEAAPLLAGVGIVLEGPPPPVPVLVDATIEGGTNHTCGLTETGAAYCWGSNDGGQLGDGTTIDRLTPVAVTGRLTFATLGVGGSAVGGFACALDGSVAAFCWGSNDVGQVGDGTTVNRMTPARVGGGHHFTSISVGSAGTCAIATDGATYCWGENTDGQLGDGTTASRSTPTLVSGGNAFVEVNVGTHHACGITADGSGYCWGNNASGQLGDGTTIQRLAPTSVSGGHTFASISAGGDVTCGVRTDHVAYCWGFNAFGTVGDGSTVAQHVPTAVIADISFASITVSLSAQPHACGVQVDGLAYCWGNNANGMVGDGTTTQRHVPALVSGHRTWASLGWGAIHTCGLDADGVAYCWGCNPDGRLGDGTTTDRSVPTPVSGWTTLP